MKSAPQRRKKRRGVKRCVVPAYRPGPDRGRGRQERLCGEPDFIFDNQIVLQKRERADCPQARNRL